MKKYWEILSANDISPHTTTCQAAAHKQLNLVCVFMCAGTYVFVCVKYWQDGGVMMTPVAPCLLGALVECGSLGTSSYHGFFLNKSSMWRWQLNAWYASKPAHHMLVSKFRVLHVRTYIYTCILCTARPHLSSSLTSRRVLLEQIYNSPTVHYILLLPICPVFLLYPQFHLDRMCADKWGLATYTRRTREH